MGGDGSPTDRSLQRQLVGYFHRLEKALDEYKRKGTPAGDPVYQKIYEQLMADLAESGVGQDQIEGLATQCGHGSTLARLEKLRKKAIGFFSGN